MSRRTLILVLALCALLSYFGALFFVLPATDDLADTPRTFAVLLCLTIGVLIHGRVEAVAQARVTRRRL